LNDDVLGKETPNFLRMAVDRVKHRGEAEAQDGAKKEGDEHQSILPLKLIRRIR